MHSPSTHLALARVRLYELFPARSHARSTHRTARRCARAGVAREHLRTDRVHVRRTTAHRRRRAPSRCSSTTMNARKTNRARRVARRPASARSAVGGDRRSVPGGWCTVIHSNTDRAQHTQRRRDSSTWRGISRRARPAHASSADAHAYVVHLSRVPRSSNRRRRRTSARSSRADVEIIQTSPLAIGGVRVGSARARVSVAVNASEEDV